MNLLLVYQLAIQSSCADDVEGDADDTHFDTVQWWITPDQAWRIRTFGVDNDVHLHHVTGPVDPAVARETTRRHYGEVIADAFEVALPDVSDREALAAPMQAHGGVDALEVDRNGARFAFWNPLQLRFQPRTEPD